MFSKSWFKSAWRPSMAWLYFVICLWDFLIAQVFFTYLNNMAYVPWEPLTLKGAGMFHIAMGGIVGVYAYQRTQEKKIEAEATDAAPNPTSLPELPVLPRIQP